MSLRPSDPAGVHLSSGYDPGLRNRRAQLTRSYALSPDIRFEHDTSPCPLHQQEPRGAEDHWEEHCPSTSAMEATTYASDSQHSDPHKNHIVSSFFRFKDRVMVKTTKLGGGILKPLSGISMFPISRTTTQTLQSEGSSGPALMDRPKSEGVSCDSDGVILGDMGTPSDKDSWHGSALSDDSWHQQQGNQRGSRPPPLVPAGYASGLPTPPSGQDQQVPVQSMWEIRELPSMEEEEEEERGNRLPLVDSSFGEDQAFTRSLKVAYSKVLKLRVRKNLALDSAVRGRSSSSSISSSDRFRGPASDLGDSPQVRAADLEKLVKECIIAEEELETMLYPCVSNCLVLARESPGKLTTALRFIDLLTQKDQEEDSGPGLSGLEHPLSCWPHRQMCYKEVEAAVCVRFQPLMDFVGSKDAVDANLILSEARSLAEDVRFLKDTVAQCFPDDWRPYDILPFLVHLYASKISDAARKLGTRATECSNAEILSLVQLGEPFAREVLNAGLGGTVAHLPEEGGAFDGLVNEYVARVRRTMSRWQANLLRLERERPQHVRNKGLLCTRLPVELLELVHGQVEVVKKKGNSLLLCRVGQEIQSLLMVFQMDLTTQWLGGGDPERNVPLEGVCERANDCVWLAREVETLAENLREDVEPRHRDELCFGRVEGVVERFRSMGEDLARRGADMVLGEEAVRDPLSLVLTREWEEDDGVSKSLVRGLNNCLYVLQTWIEGGLFCCLVDVCLMRIVECYVGEMQALKAKGVLSATTMERAKGDGESIRRLFLQYGSLDGVSFRMLPLQSLVHGV